MSKALKIAKKLTPRVNDLLVAMVFAKAERKRVDPIMRKVLAEGNYTGRKPLRDGTYGPDFRVLDLDDTMFLIRGDSEAYHGRLNSIHLANGFADAAKGYCPALVAERNVTKAEWALIDAALEFFPSADNDSLLLGTKEKGGLETRREYLDSLIGLVVNSPGYRKPKLL